MTSANADVTCRPQLAHADRVNSHTRCDPCSALAVCPIGVPRINQMRLLICDDVQPRCRGGAFLSPETSQREGRDVGALWNGVGEGAF